MIFIKTDEEIAKLREGGPVLARIVSALAKEVRPGISTKALDDLAMKFISEAGAEPALLRYRPEGAPYPYPACICISVNSEIVHGIPVPTKIIQAGDIVSLDLVIRYKQVYLDHTITVPVGEISKKDKELLSATKAALDAGISAITPGATIGDIGAAIQEVAKAHRLGIIRDLSGHGVGRKIHEDPYVPNFGKSGKGEKLMPGMVLAIEPMFSAGGDRIVVLADGYTIKTADNARAAHFEHTVLITETGAEILTIEK